MRLVPFVFRRNAHPVFLIGLFFVTAALAGCLGGDEGDAQDVDRREDPILPGNETDPSPPVAPLPPGGGGPSAPPVPLHILPELAVDRQIGWTGEPFMFSGNGTTANGEIARYVLGHGDGNETVVETPDEPVFNVTYDLGGIYMVNLTVFVVGEDEETLNETASVFISVNERHGIDDGELDAGYLFLSQDDEHTEVYPVRFGAMFYNLTLEISDESNILGDSAGEVTLFGPDGNVTASQGFEDSGTLTLAGTFNMTNIIGDHTFSIRLTEGEIAFSGTFEIYYGIDPDEHDLE